MKISQLSTDRSVDVLCGIAPYVENIVTDDELIKELRTALDFTKANTRAEQ